METKITLTEEDKVSLNDIYKISVAWKWILLIIMIVLCTMFLYFALADEMYFMLWFFIFSLLFGIYSFKKNQKKLQCYEKDLQDNIKIRVKGTITDFVFEEAAQYFSFCEDGHTQSEIFLLSYKNDKHLGGVNMGVKVQLEYTPYCRLLLNIQTL